MKYRFMLLVLACVMTAVAGLATAQTTAQATKHTDAEIAAADELFKAMDLETVFSASIQRTVDMQIKQNPAIAPYRQVMLDFFAKYMSWASLKDDMAQIYMDEFSIDEIKELTAFYKTPVGHKVAQRLPELMGKGAEVGMRKVQQHMGELQQAIAAETQRIRDQQK